jgi:hypothetical protein
LINGLSSILADDQGRSTLDSLAALDPPGGGAAFFYGLTPRGVDPMNWFFACNLVLQMA